MELCTLDRLHSIHVPALSQHSNHRRLALITSRWICINSIHEISIWNHLTSRFQPIEVAVSGFTLNQQEWSILSILDIYDDGWHWNTQMNRCLQGRRRAIVLVNGLLCVFFISTPLILLSSSLSHLLSVQSSQVSVKCQVFRVQGRSAPLLVKKPTLGFRHWRVWARDIVQSTAHHFLLLSSTPTTLNTASSVSLYLLFQQ